MKNHLAGLFSSLLFLTAGAGELTQNWNFPDGCEFERTLPAAMQPDYSRGFRLTADFICDLEALDARKCFANLVTKGRDFDQAFSVMIRKNGDLMVDVKGCDPEYEIVELGLKSGRRYRLDVLVRPGIVSVWVDGKVSGGYPLDGVFQFDPKLDLKVGKVGGYEFKGRLFSLQLEALTAETAEHYLPQPDFEPPRQQARAEILWTHPICIETNRYIGWPTVCRLKNGDLLAVFSGDRERHVCPWGKIQAVRSTDGGETWSAPQIVANGPIDDRDAGVTVMPDGEVIVTYFTSVAYRSTKVLNTDWPISHPKAAWKRHDEKISEETRKAALGYFLVRSSDNGRTWGTPEKMNLDAHAPHGPIVLKDGGLLQFGLVQLPDDVCIIRAMRSDDAGRTWQTVCDEVGRSGRNRLGYAIYDEPHVAELPDGTLVGFVRNNADETPMVMKRAISKDGGKTWTPFASTGLAGLPPYLTALGDGKVICVYGRRERDPGFGEFAAISDDGGVTWDAANEICLARSHGIDLGYPSTAVLPNGTLVTVYYQQRIAGERPCLMATKWRLVR